MDGADGPVCDGGDGQPAFTECADCGTLCRACDVAMHALPKTRGHVRRSLQSVPPTSEPEPLVFDMPSSAHVDGGASRLNRRVPSAPVPTEAAVPTDPPPPYTPPTEEELRAARAGAIPRRARRKTRCEEFQHHLRLYCTIL